MKTTNEYTMHSAWHALDELTVIISRHKTGRGSLDLLVKSKTKAAVNYFNSFRTKHLLAPLNWHTKLDTVSVELQQIANQYANWIDGGVTSASMNVIETSIDRCIQVFREWPVQVSANSDQKFNEAQTILDEIANYRDEQDLIFRKTQEQLQILESELQKAITLWNTEAESLNLVKREVKTATADIAIETKKELSEDAAETKKNFIAVFESIVTESTELKGKISALLEESENLASLKAGQVISEGYERYARDLDKLRSTWHRNGFIVLALGIPVLLVFLFNGGDLDVGLQYFLKTSITITIGALVAYSFREAGQAGKAAEIARYRHLDSVALSTYLRGLKSDSSIISIQEELGKRLASERDPSGQSDAKSTAKVAKQLIKSLEKIISRASR